MEGDVIIGIVEKAQETSPDTGMHNTVHICAIPVQCLGMLRHTSHHG